MGDFKRSETQLVTGYVTIIEQIIKEWNLDPAQIKDPNHNRWYLIQGSARFHIDVFKYNKGPSLGDVDCIEVGAIIMKLPSENILPLYRRLLDLNGTSVGLYFAVRKDVVMLLSTRELKDLDENELRLMINEVRFYADYWDDSLIQEFGGSK